MTLRTPDQGRKAASSANTGWDQLMVEHARAAAHYRLLSENAAEARDDEKLEDMADAALRELMKIEERAMRMPATDVVSLRFKLSLWSDGRMEGFEEEWRVFAGDCERLIVEASRPRQQRA